MKSVRSSSFRAVRQVSTGAATQQLRRLHITGTESAPSQLLTKSPASLAKAEINDAVTRNAPRQGRSFRMATAGSSKRPLVDESPITSDPVRHFNTTRSLKAVRDSSTIDFAYMPQFELIEPSHPEVLRIPLLPDNYSPDRKSEALQEAVEPVMRPEISTVSADGTHITGPSAMSEVTDNHSVELDPYTLVTAVNAAASKMTALPIEKLKEPGVIKQFWDGFVEDLMGGKKVHKP